MLRSSLDVIQRAGVELSVYSPSAQYIVGNPITEHENGISDEPEQNVVEDVGSTNPGASTRQTRSDQFNRPYRMRSTGERIVSPSR